LFEATIRLARSWRLEMSENIRLTAAGIGGYVDRYHHPRTGARLPDALEVRQTREERQERAP
jgi:hypothetical protein